MSLRPQTTEDIDKLAENSDSEIFSEDLEETFFCCMCGNLQESWDSGIVETDKFIASTNGACSGCKILFEGLSLVTDLGLVAKLRFDFDAGVIVSCWDSDPQAHATTYEFYISSPVEIDGAWSRTFSRDLLSPLCERLNLAKSWLDLCREQHLQCPPITNKLPKRILVLEDADNNVRLYETTGEKGSYVALSYCWGTAQNLKTTQENLKEMSKRIDMRTVPKTILDAIYITRYFGFKYLWIDSLCIVQDSTADWEEQAPQMRDVYGNAAFVIAAHSSKGVDGGCLSTGQTRNRTLATVDALIKEECMRVSIRMDSCHNGLSPAHSIDGKDRSNLESRGWTLQEYLLAPRILHCTDSEMAWECMGHSCCECSAESRADLGFEIGAGTFRQLVFRNPDSWQQHGPSVDTILDCWQDLVEEFTSRSLTFPGDKLLAISGLASVISEKFPSICSPTDYLFGLWHRNLIADLLWRNDGRSIERQPQNRAPSWSWASLSHGNISYPAKYSIVDWVGNWEFINECEILSVHCSHSTQSRFGAGTGRIKIKGMLRSITLNRKRKRPQSGILKLADMDLAFDVHTDPDPDRTYFVFVLARVVARKQRATTTKREHGLLLIESGVEKGSFCRVGYARGHAHRLSWTSLAGGETRIIDLL